MCDEGTPEEQKIYLDKVIEKIAKFSTTNAYYYIILGHYPVWSIGELGPNDCLISKLRTTLHKYKVDGYFSGHEHAMEHFRDTYMGHTVEYLVAGASNFVIDKPENKDKIDQNILKFFWDTKEDQYVNCKNCSGSIVLGKADKNQMNLRYIDTKHNEIYSFIINSRPRNSSNNLVVLYTFNLVLVIVFLMLH